MPPKTSSTRDPEATRRQLLEAAFAEIYEHGFQAASLERILTAAGVTKGALYHHFENKQALGYAVVDDLMGPFIHDRWVEPMEASDDPTATFREMFHRLGEGDGLETIDHGCPINNLAQEMSPLDEGFRKRIQRIFDAWQRSVAGALERGKAAGRIRRDIDPERTAFFILASLEGTIGLAKNHQDQELLQAGWYGLERFLEALRPSALGVA